MSDEDIILLNYFQPHSTWRAKAVNGEEEIIYRISHNTALNSVDTLLEYIDQWEFY